MSDLMRSFHTSFSFAHNKRVWHFCSVSAKFKCTIRIHSVLLLSASLFQSFSRFELCQWSVLHSFFHGLNYLLTLNMRMKKKTLSAYRVTKWDQTKNNKPQKVLHRETIIAASNKAAKNKGEILKLKMQIPTDAFYLWIWPPETVPMTGLSTLKVPNVYTINRVVCSCSSICHHCCPKQDICHTNIVSICIDKRIRLAGYQPCARCAVVCVK